MAFGPDGRMYAWDGYRTVYSYNPDTREWSAEHWEGSGPYNGYGAGLDGSPTAIATYSKFVHFEDGIFGGIAFDGTGFWFYKPSDAFKVWSP